MEEQNNIYKLKTCLKLLPVDDLRDDFVLQPWHHSTQSEEQQHKAAKAKECSAVTNFAGRLFRESIRQTQTDYRLSTQTVECVLPIKSK